MEKQIIFDFEQTRSILSRRDSIASAMEELVLRAVTESKADLTRRLNKTLYDMAEEQGVTLYDICFSTMPDCKYDIQENGFVINVIFKPIKLTSEPENAWIKVEERLPESDGDVLVYDDICGIVIASHTPCVGWLSYVHGALDHVTHWSPLVLPNKR